MSEANETNDILTKIKEQIMIATHETGKMPKIFSSNKKANSKTGYKYDEKENKLFLREGIWELIKDDLNADLSSGGVVMNVSIKPLKEIGDMSDKDEEELQEEVDKVNQKSRYEYYRLIKYRSNGSEVDGLLCYSFNDPAERKNFAEEMDNAFGIGGEDFDQDRDDGERKEIYEDFDKEDNDREIVIVRREKKHDDKKTDGKKGPDDDIDKNNGKDQKSEKSDGNDKQIVQPVAAKEVNDGKWANNQEGTQNQQGNTEKGPSPTAVWQPQSIEEEFRLINSRELPNRFSYLEEYFDAAKKYNEPKGYSWKGGLEKRQVFNWVDKESCGLGTNIVDESDESLLMHIFSDALYTFLGYDSDVTISRDKNSVVNEMKVYMPDVKKDGRSWCQVGFVGSPFEGYLARLAEEVAVLLGQSEIKKVEFGSIIMYFILRDYYTVLDYKDGLDKRRDKGKYDKILPYSYLEPEWIAYQEGGNKSMTIEHVYGDVNTFDVPSLDINKAMTAYEIAAECGDTFPSMDRKRNMYYWYLACTNTLIPPISKDLQYAYGKENVGKRMLELSKSTLKEKDFLSVCKDPISRPRKIEAFLGLESPNEARQLMGYPPCPEDDLLGDPPILHSVNERPRSSLSVWPNHGLACYGDD